MDWPQNRYSEVTYTLLRITSAFLFSCHGAQKLFGVLSGMQQVHSLRGLTAGIIEFFGGLLIALGLFTRIAAFISSGEMAVAYFWVHAHRNFWPIINKGELAIVLSFVFLHIATRGAGKYSVDALLVSRRTRVAGLPLSGIQGQTAGLPTKPGEP